MAIDQVHGVIAPANRPPTRSRRPFIDLVRSLAMVALACVGILVLLPAAIAAQSAAAL